MVSTEQSLAISRLISWDAAAHDEELLHAAKNGSHTAFIFKLKEL